MSLWKVEEKSIWVQEKEYRNIRVRGHPDRSDPHVRKEIIRVGLVPKTVHMVQYLGRSVPSELEQNDIHVQDHEYGGRLDSTRFLINFVQVPEPENYRDMGVQYNCFCSVNYYTITMPWNTDGNAPAALIDVSETRFEKFVKPLLEKYDHPIESEYDQISDTEYVYKYQEE